MVVGNEGFVALALTHNTTCRQSYYTMHALFTERKVHKFVGNITLWTWLPMIQPLMQHMIKWSYTNITHAQRK